MAEVERDERLHPGQLSRTRIAYESGILKMIKCHACNGQGVVRVAAVQ